MPYQETVFPIWADILIVIIVPIVIFLLLRYEPPAKKEEKQTQSIKTDNHVKERYGAYIRSQGRYYN